MLGVGHRGSALQTASDEAANQRRSRSSTRPALRPSDEGRLVELLWKEPDRAAAILERFAPPAPAENATKKLGFREADPSAKAKAADEREAISRLLGRCAGTAPESLRLELAEAFSREGAFTPPLLVVVGQLAPCLDEGELLRAQAASARPFVSASAKLRETLESIEQLLATPGMEGPGASALARVMADRLKEDFALANRGLPSGYLDETATRIALERRAYERRTVLGAPYLRGQLLLVGDKKPIPTYLPESLSEALPSFSRLHAAMVVELHVAQDQYESHPLCLRALALGRVLESPHAA